MGCTHMHTHTQVMALAQYWRTGDTHIAATQIKCDVLGNMYGHTRAGNSNINEELWHSHTHTQGYWIQESTLIMSQPLGQTCPLSFNP